PKVDTDINCSSVLYQIDGYSAFPSLDGGRGVIIYAKSHLNVSPNSHMNSLYNDGSWCDWLVDKETVLLGAIYRSPSTDESCVTINRLLNEASRSGHRLLVTGDFNMKDINWENYSTCHNENHHEYEFIECLRDNFLFQHVVEPTRFRENQTPHILDLIITNDQHDIEDITILPSLGVSDHVLIKFDFVFSFKEFHNGKPKVKYGRCDFVSFTNEWDNIDWEEKFTEHSVDEMWAIFVEQYQESVNRHVPKYTPKKGCKPKPLWMTADTLNSIRNKRHAWSQYRATKRPADFERYKRIRNKTNEDIRNAKRNFEKKISKKAKKESKHFWKYVNSKVKSQSNVTNLQKSDSTLTSSDQEKAEVLNDYFSKVFTRENLDDMPDIANKVFDIPLDSINIDIAVVETVLKGLDGGKSMGPDELNPLLLKSMSNIFSTPLTLIFQESIRSGRIPEVWKDARVTPLFKKGQKSNPGNYRPVSLTSVVCKCLEKIVRASVIEHLVRNNLISSAQFGFRSGRSCVLQLIDVMEDWSKLVENDESWDTVYLDFAKAFDSVPHQRLINKISAYGIRGQLLSWIRDFLTGRRQYVTVKGESSSWQNVISGVPQGSVLGPVLFVIYINDLPEVVNSTVKIFADDTKLYNTDSKADILQQDLDALFVWSELWQLRFNVEKCKTIHFGRNNQEYQYTLHFEDIDSDTEEKDLGVIFQRDLKFSSHIATKVNKANSILSLIIRTFDFIEQDSFVLLYKALVRPHVEYGNTIWYPFLRKDINSVENIQKRATRLIPQLKDLSYTERLKKLKLPTLAHRRRRGDMLQTFKILNGLEDIPSERFFNVATNSSTRGHNFKLEKPRCNTSFRLQHFSQRIINDWNALPSFVVNAKDVKDFKAKLDLHWSHEVMYQY
ncbi:MAG: reverse transcriptase family protein, partial [Candidatus Thiodiazotropha sp.]